MLGSAENKVRQVIELKDGTKKLIRSLGAMLFLLYVLLLVYFLFFSEEYGRGAEAEHVYHYNLIPFREIIRFWKYKDVVGENAFYLNVLGNMIGFLPFGFILPIIQPKMNRFGLIVLSGFLLSLFVEVIQLFTMVGRFDVDDLLLNTVGALVGYLLFAVCNQIRRNYYGKKI